MEAPEWGVDGPNEGPFYEYCWEIFLPYAARGDARARVKDIEICKRDSEEKLQNLRRELEEFHKGVVKNRLLLPWFGRR